jgi:hypothetical protein
MGVGGYVTLRRFTLWKETRYPLYRKLGEPQGPSGRMRKVSPLLGFDPRTVHPVSSFYTDWAIPVIIIIIIFIIIIRLIICVYFLSFAFVCITQNSKFRQVWHAVCIVKQNLPVMLRLSVCSVTGNVISTAGIVARMHVWVIAFVILQSYLL